MKRFIQSALAALGGKGKGPDILSPGQFTEEFVAAYIKSSSGLEVKILSDLELKLKCTDGREHTAFLYNAYDSYKGYPDSKEETISRFVASLLETSTTGPLSGEELDRSRIVPVIKDRQWLAEIRNAMASRGAEKIPENVYEDFNAELVVVYAEDSPKNLRYLRVEDLEKANIDRKDLRKLASENLKRLLPDIERHGAEGVYMLVAGGDFEASLLLFDSIWTGMQSQVRGDVVVAVPARDVLLVTSSDDPEGIQKVKDLVKQTASKAAYRLTSKLFVYRDGKFDEFQG